MSSHHDSARKQRLSGEWSDIPAIPDDVAATLSQNELPSTEQQQRVRLAILAACAEFRKRYPRHNVR